MSPESSVTRWLNLLKVGNRDAARILWERYFRLLVSCARQRLGDAPRRAADEDDVAVSAFASFLRGVEKGRFPRLDDRRDLRCVLLLLVARKAAHQIRDEMRAKRGGGNAPININAPDQEALAVLIDSEPTPDLAAQISEECDRLLDMLDAEDLRAIASWQVEGFTVAEIADKLGCSPRTVARKLTQIRDLWNPERLTP